MKKNLFLSPYEFLLCLFYVLLLIVGKNEIFSSKVDKVGYIKRQDTIDNDCSRLKFSTVLSNTKVFGFYDPLKPLENSYPVVEFIKEIGIDYLNYIVDIYNLEANVTMQQELKDLRSNFSSKELQILLSITSTYLNSVYIPGAPRNSIIGSKVVEYGFDGVNIIKNDCFEDNSSLSRALDNIDKLHSNNWNESLITTFTVNANDRETPLTNISSIQEHVNYTIIQAFYLDPDDNYSAPQNDSSHTVTFDSLFKQLDKELKGDFKKLIWGFDLSGIIKNDSGLIAGLTTGLKRYDDQCLKNNDFYIWPWKEIRNTALKDMCIANNNGWDRHFDTDTNSAILWNPTLSVSNVSYEDPESLYNKFKWVTSNNFFGISIANLGFDSIDNGILKFIAKTAPKNNESTNTSTGNTPTTTSDPDDPNDDNNNHHNGTTSENTINNKNNKNNKVIVGVVVGCTLFAIGLLIGFFYCSRRRKRNPLIEVKSIEDKHHYLDQPVAIPLSPTPPPPSPSPTPQQNSIVPTNGIYASALYDFEGKEENELNFSKGDLIEVIEKGDGPNSWWKGKINGIVGDFPGNYVLVK